MTMPFDMISGYVDIFCRGGDLRETMQNAEREMQKKPERLRIVNAIDDYKILLMTEKGFDYYLGKEKGENHE